jgi:hypothetical protein
MGRKAAHSLWQNVILDRKIKIAEIGVWRGSFAKTMLRNHREYISEYWAIDRWRYLGWDYPGGDWDRDQMKKLSEEEWTAIYAHICRLWLWFPELRVVRMASADAAKIFPQEYFDLVYVDADHSYQEVMRDITIWLPLIKKGGVISGHDCVKKLPGVVQAVEEFFDGDFKRAPKTIWYKQL